MKNIDVKKSRFRDASWFEKVDNFNMPVIIGGAGGIGSWLTLFLARMLPSTGYIFLYDFDRVEEVNMAGQLFEFGHINKSKVVAVEDIVDRFSQYTGLSCQNEKYVKDSLKSPVMFSAFDNMEARKVMFENWKSEAASNPEQAIFIDGRLLAEQLQVFLFQ